MGGSKGEDVSFCEFNDASLIAAAVIDVPLWDG